MCYYSFNKQIIKAMNKKLIKTILEIAKYVISAILGYLGGNGALFDIGNYLGF